MLPEPDPGAAGAADRPGPAGPGPRLSCRGLTGGRDATVVFRDLDLDVPAGSVLALLGPNGAGKSTLMLTLAGLLPARRGAASVDGVPLRNGDAVAASRAGLVLVPDNRSLFPSLTVAENLEVARRRRGPAPRDVLAVFPALERRWTLRAGSLSGGEQQMLAMARAIVQEPKVLLVDEMSMGLAPLVVESLFETVRRIARDHDAAVVLVEQHVKLALEVADEAAVLNRGAVVLRGPAEELQRDGHRIELAYLGEHEPVI
jgi:branched-chain amino acid transport system ATP-binding protein